MQHDFDLVSDRCVHCHATSEKVEDGCVPGECPGRPAVHHPACSNQNVVDPLGAYRGASTCDCRTWWG